MTRDAVTQTLSAVCPWLVLTLCLQHVAAWSGLKLRRWELLLLPGAIALGVLLLPLGGIAVARWTAGLNANFSIPLTGLLAVAVWERAFARPVFAKQDWTAAWSVGAIGGFSLYPLALGIGSFDPYEWGWSFSPLFVVVAALTGWLIWKGNRFGFLLLLSIASFHLRLLESSNYWDYLLDPIYWFTSIIVLSGRGVSAWSRRRLLRSVP